MDISSKTCKKCKQVKPVEEFYFLTGARDSLFSECKDCCKKKTRGQKAFDRLVPSNETEGAVIQQLARNGIPALPGKSLAHRHTDVVAWGCVMIEVKSSNPLQRKGRPTYSFGFSPKQRVAGVRGDLIVLVCISESERTYHILPADHAAFFRNGSLKKAVSYCPGATFHYHDPRNPALTLENMNYYKDAWHLVEAKRLEVQARILTGETYPFTTRMESKLSANVL